MKTLTILLLIILGAFADAKPNVVLISSLDTPDIWFHSDDWEIEKPLKKIINKGFKDTDYNIVVIEKATPTQLRNELLNPNNIALFWVSHAAGSSNVASGVMSSSAVVDYYFNDVKVLFTEVHPNMKFLGLVGCNAQGTIEKFYEEGHYANNPSLQIHSFDKKVDARTGLKKSIKESSPKLGFLKQRAYKFPTGSRRVRYRDLPIIIEEQDAITNFYETQVCNLQYRGHKVSVTRELEKDADQAALLMNDKLMGYFEAAKAGESQTIDVYIPNEFLTSTAKLKFKIDSLKFFSKERVELGRLSFESDFSGRWELFARRNGEPLGYTSNLYRYKGTINELEATQYSKFNCLN